MKAMEMARIRNGIDSITSMKRAMTVSTNPPM